MFGQFLLVFQLNILPSSRGNEKPLTHVCPAIHCHCGNSMWKEVALNDLLRLWFRLLYLYGNVCTISRKSICGLYIFNYGPGSNPGGDDIFLPSRPALGLTQPPVKWVPRLSRG